MNRNTVLRSAAATLAALVVGIGIPSTVSAASPSPAPSPSGSASAATVAAIKARCAGAIDTRETALTGDLKLVSGDDALTPAHRAALSNMITSDQSGLSALRAKIEADTTVAELKADCPLIVTDYRVYVLLQPQIHLVSAADRTEHVDAQLSTVSSELKAALANANIPASLRQSAEQSIDDLNSKISQSEQAVNPIAPEVLALTPAGYPANASTLVAARNNLQTSRAALDGAMADIQAVLKDLGGH